MPYKDPSKRKAWRQKRNQETNHAYDRKYRATHPEKRMLDGAKQRAKKSGLEVSIDETDIVIPAVCPILGMPLVIHAFGDKHGRCQDDSPTLDRIDPTRGYVKGNVQVISWRANRIKCDGTLDELRRIVAYMEAHHT